MINGLSKKRNNLSYCGWLLCVNQAHGSGAMLESLPSLLLILSLFFCFFTAGQVSLLDSDLSAETKVGPIWSPGALMYYGRAELQASDHR